MSAHDLFGKALMSYYSGETKEYFIERDDGHTDIIQTATYFEDYEKWPLNQREAIKEAKGTVLDVGCGAGRVALQLQKQGLKVVAIDISPDALKVAQMRGVKDCRLMDVTRLEFPENYFDTIIAYGNNFGIAGGIMETQKLLEIYYRVTKLDGILITSIIDPLQTDNPAHLRYHDNNRLKGNPPGLVKIRIGFKGEYGEYFKLLMVTRDELSELIKPGWKIEKIYDSKEGEYIAILTKSDDTER